MTDRAALEKAIEHSRFGHELITHATHPGETTSPHSVMTLDAAAVHLLRAAAQAHLGTLPRVKMIETYHVEFVFPSGEPEIYVCADKVIAEGRARRLKHEGRLCVRVTGPHSHQVPAT